MVEILETGLRFNNGEMVARKPVLLPLDRPGLQVYNQKTFRDRETRGKTFETKTDEHPNRSRNFIASNTLYFDDQPGSFT